MASITKTDNLLMLLAGCLMGFGLMAVFSIGIPFFLAGLLLSLYRVARVGGRGFWLVLVGMGAVPALYLSLAYLFADRSNTFYPESYFLIVFVFVALALAGATLGVVEMRRAQRGD